jgi:uncharacterized SAM-binding protein YcdF (DUF218 family)
LLLSGGGRGRLAEAEIMRREALRRGVPETALLVEPNSSDTVGNACECAQLLRRHRLSSVILVSDRTHLLRARLLFRLAGIEVAASAGNRPSSPLWEIGAALREALALPRSLLRAALQLRSRRR